MSTMDEEKASLRDKDKGAYMRAITEWAASGDIDRVRAAYDDADLPTRANILSLLGEAPPSAETLRLLLRASTEESWVRFYAVYALRQYVTPEVLQRLTDALADPDELVQNSALNALREFAENIPIEPIVSLLGMVSSKDAASYHAAQTLLRHPHRERVPLAPLLWRIMHPHWEHRLTFTNELGAIEQQLLAQPALVADACEATRMAAMRILRGMGDRAPRAAIFTALDHWLPPLRAEAVEVCGECCHPIPGNKLLALLADPNSFVRVAAAHVLVRQRHPVHPVWFAAACALLEDTDEWVQLQMVHLVASRLPTSHLLPYLDESHQWRGKSLDALLRELIQRPDTPTSVIEQATQKGYWWDLRRDALLQLAHRPDASIAPIEAALDDRTEEVREAARQALQQLRGEPDTPPVNDEPHDGDSRDEIDRDEPLPEPATMPPDQVAYYLRHIEPTIWQAGVAAVQAQRETFPIEPLLALLSEERGGARAHALMALAELGSRVPAQPLLDALYDTDTGEVREEIRHIYEVAIDTLHRTHPEVMPALEDEAVAHLLGAPAGSLLSPLADIFACEVIGAMHDPTPDALERVAILVEHPNWRLRLAAVDAVIALISTSGWLNGERPYSWRPFPPDIESRLTTVTADQTLPAHLRKRAQYAISCLPENERRRPTDA